MSATKETDALNNAIFQLEVKQAAELTLLKEQFFIAYESIKPINLIKSTFREVVSSPALKDNLLGNVLGLTTGFLSKKILIGTTRNPIKKILGTVLQFAVAKIVAKNSDTIKSTGAKILNRISKNRNDEEEIFSENGN